MNGEPKGKRHYRTSLWPHCTARAVELLREAFRRFDYNHFTALQLLALDPKHTTGESRIFVSMGMLVEDVYEGRKGFRVTSRVGRAVADERRNRTISVERT